MKENLALTICSNNYLNKAIALKESFLKYNKDYLFYIILVDEFIEDFNYDLLFPATIIKASDINLYDFEDLIHKYNIIELNTSIKPSVIKYLYQLNPNIKNIYYLDPDLYFYDSLIKSEKLLNKGKSLVLTPHIMNEIPRDDMSPDENIFLNYGLYNLGFIGINMLHTETSKILNWWEERTLNYGFDNTKKGYFVDQLWMNLVPIFFNDVCILKDYGYNMAPWNLHERVISLGLNSEYMVNNDKLVFYHFSKLANNKIDVSGEYDRFKLDEVLFLRDLYDDYKKITSAIVSYDFKKTSIAYPLKPLKINPDRKTFLFRLKNKLKRKLKSILL